MLEIVGGSGTTIAVTSARTQTFTFPNFEGVAVTYALTATTAGAAETVVGWKIDNGADQRSGTGNIPALTALVVQPGMSAKLEITSSYTLASGYKVATKLVKGAFTYTIPTFPATTGTTYGVGETHVYGPTAKTANKHFDMRPPQGVNLVDVLAALFNLSDPAKAALFLDNIENGVTTFQPTLP